LLKEGKQTKSLWKSVIEKDLLTTNANTNAKLKININGVSIFDIPSLKNREEKIIGTTSLTSQAVNSIVLSDAKNSDLDSVEVEGETIKDWFVQDEASIVIKNVKKGSSIIVRILKLNDAYSSLTINPVDKVNKKESFVINCDNFRKDYFSYYIKDEERKKLLELSSKNASPCISFYLPSLDHDSAYLVNVENKNITGRGLHFWVLNEDQKTPLIDTYFEKSKKEQNSQVILPPMEKFGKAYSLHLDNISIGNTASGNLIGNINIHPIPYYFITNLNLVDSSASPLEFGKQKFEVSHPNQSLYVIKPDKQEGFVLSLSQSYSPYWKAYEINVKCPADAKALAGRQISNVKCLLTETFPFIFGEEIQNHVKLNNWKNGWIVDDSNVQCPADAKALAGRQMSNVKCQIVIVFLPQYFEYIGFGLLVFTLTVLSISLLKNKRLASN
ncbi:MAG: hypothetical protein HYV38_02160, partial [Candidatus Levybacteria bacterium]|nr:hypothetical protein [Candidatus Levybacteria bacterium]